MTANPLTPSQACLDRCTDHALQSLAMAEKACLPVWKVSDIADFIRETAEENARVRQEYDSSVRASLPRNLTFTIRLAPGEVPPAEVMVGDFEVQHERTHQKAKLWGLGAELVEAVADGVCVMAKYRVGQF